MKALNQPLTIKRAAMVLALLAGVFVVAWGGWQVVGRITNRPPTASNVRSSIWSFLKKQSGTSNFDTEFESAAVSNALETTSFTNKAGKVKSVARGKRNELGLPETSLSAYFRTNHAEAPTYEAMYRLIGQQLKVTEHLLESEDITQKHSGLVMASEASAYARNNAMNLWLAARICEGYLWPNLSLVEGTNRVPFTPDALLNICDVAFKEAGETNNVIRNYEYYIAKTARPQQSDVARLRLARIYEELSEYGKALALLKEVKTIKNARMDQQIAMLEQRAKRKQ